MNTILHINVFSIQFVAMEHSDTIALDIVIASMVRSVTMSMVPVPPTSVTSGGKGHHAT